MLLSMDLPAQVKQLPFLFIIKRNRSWERSKREGSSLNERHFSWKYNIVALSLESRNGPCYSIVSSIILKASMCLHRLTLPNPVQKVQCEWCPWSYVRLWFLPFHISGCVSVRLFSHFCTLMKVPKIGLWNKPLFWVKIFMFFSIVKLINIRYPFKVSLFCSNFGFWFFL